MSTLRLGSNDPYTFTLTVTSLITGQVAYETCVLYTINSTVVDVWVETPEINAAAQTVCTNVYAKKIFSFVFQIL